MWFVAMHLFLVFFLEKFDDMIVGAVMFCTSGFEDVVGMGWIPPCTGAFEANVGDELACTLDGSASDVIAPSSCRTVVDALPVGGKTADQGPDLCFGLLAGRFHALESRDHMPCLIVEEPGKTCLHPFTGLPGALAVLGMGRTMEMSAAMVVVEHLFGRGEKPADFPQIHGVPSPMRQRPTRSCGVSPASLTFKILSQVLVRSNPMPTDEVLEVLCSSMR